MIGGGGGLNFIKEIPLKTNPRKVEKKFQTLKILLKFASGNRQVGGQFSKNPLPVVFLNFLRGPWFQRL